MIDTLIVLAKQPIPGRVKTRLMPDLSAHGAAAVAAAALADTLELAEQTSVAHRQLVFEGEADEWLPAGWSTCAQVAGGLDERMIAAFEGSGPGPAMLIGMDTPQLRAEQLGVFDPARYDCCLGPTEDGGYWTIGFRDPLWARPALFGIPMSMPYTADRQLHRLRQLGLTVQILDLLADVDTFGDAVTVADLAPASRMASALAQLGVQPALGVS